ncbi:hypothetical protein JAAARDRAFT_704813 [Jaapia argillacea MUCL 33604]|uniref:BTB domain-containing protein n=1 Tax=Jaapia argillacea MUCL 33604 TaxID=933084 RepID=A0A067Q5S4_9AGAM|nr:hypothetical protein JAAARDRAFT_704813 [Jaapia argillacea MUCL 33604]
MSDNEHTLIQGSQNSPATRLAAAPFDNLPDADIILRSTDYVDFRVHKGVLSIASPIFGDMFRMGREEKKGEEIGGLPVVPMLTEDSKVLDIVLRLCYPVDKPTFDKVEDIQRILPAAEKYQMGAALKHLGEKLVSPQFLIPEPFRVFAVARRYDMENEVRIAAKQTLRHSLPGPDIPEMKSISASSHLQLWEFRNCRVIPATVVASNFSWVANREQVKREWSFLGGCSCAKDVTTPVNFADGAISPTKYWREYMRRAETALGSNPSGTTVTSAAILWPTVGDMRISGCPTCSAPRALENLRIFSEVFATEIERVTIEVNLFSGMVIIHRRNLLQVTANFQFD